MQKSVIFTGLVVGVFFGTVGFGELFGQGPCGTTYRRPSESDIAWLLGCGNTTISCEPKCNGVLRNPACCCADCVQPNASPTPAHTAVETDVSVITLAPIPLPSGCLIQQVGHVVESPEPIENPDAAPSDAPIRHVAAKRPAVALPSSPKPPLEPESSQAAPPQKLKTTTRISATPLPSSCSCSECAVKKPIGDNAVPHCDRSVECRKSCCDSASFLSDDLFGWATSLHRTRTKHGSCCTCPYCLVFDVPDMVGDTGRIPYHLITVSSGASLFVQSQPTFLMSRLNVAEHFNLEAKNRIWLDYRHLSNGIEWDPGSGRSGAVDCFTVGVEKKISAASSVEFRLPVYNQLSSRQPGGGDDAELGNISLAYKYMIFRSQDYTFGGGMAVVCPTAENWRYSTSGLTATYKNGAINLVPYLGVLWHPGSSTFGQLLVQADIPVSKNTLQFDGQSFDVREQSLVRIGLQLGRWFYRNEKGRQSCRLGGFVEFNYAAALDNSVAQSYTDVLLGSAKNKPQMMTLGAGIPVQFGKLSIVNAIIAPIGNDRSFSVAYDFSLNRRF